MSPGADTLTPRTEGRVHARTVLTLVLAAVLGILAIVVPAWLWPPARSYAAPLFPLLRTALEGIGLRQLVLLFATGALLGLISRLPAWLLGVAAVSLLPVAVFAEMLKAPSSHNLFPFELVFYTLYGAIAALGVVAARHIRRTPPRERF